MNKVVIVFFIAGALLLAMSGCGKQVTTTKTAKKTTTEGSHAHKSDGHGKHHAEPSTGGHAHKGHGGHHHGGHAHTAPHGGTLVVLGEELAHVEFVLDAKTGTLTAYVLDRDAKAGVRLKQEKIRLHVKRGFREADIELAAVANSLTGERPGDSSQFVGQNDVLKDAKVFDVALLDMNVKGIAFAKTEFKFPIGNEGGHHHAHGAHGHGAHAHGKQDAHAHGKQDAHAHGKQDAHAHGKQDAHAHGKQDAHAHGKQDAHAHGKQGAHDGHGH